MGSQKKEKNFNLLDNTSLKQKYFITGVILFLVLLIFYQPIVFQGLEPVGSDTIAGMGKRHQVREYTEKTGEQYLWNPNIFCGFPEYFTQDSNAFNIDELITKLNQFIMDWRIFWFLLGAIGIFLLLNFLKFPWYFSLIGAIAFLFFPHLQGLILVGHNTKIRAVMVMPILLFSFLNFTQKRSIPSIAFFALLLSLLFKTKHYQIIFYTLLLIMTAGIYKITVWVREKQYRNLLTSFAMFIPALIIAVLMSALPLFVAKDYTPHSTRGGNAIKLSEEVRESAVTDKIKSGGVSFEYATRWSYSLKEYLGTLIPRAMGGTSHEIYKGKQYSRYYGRSLPTYWGDMQFTQSSEYFGIIIVILALTGIVWYRKNGFVIALSVLLLFSFLLSLGKHFSPLYKLFFYHFPYFDKFRVPMMILILIDFILIVLAMYGLKGFTDNFNKNKFKTAAVISSVFAGLGLLFAVFPDILSFSAASDAQYASRPQVIEILKNIRKEYLTHDAFRMFILAGIFIGSIWLYYKRKVDKVFIISVFILLVSYDLITTSYRFLGDAQLRNIDYMERQYFSKTKFDRIMEKETGQYRVLGLGRLFQSNDLAYRHQLVSGYSAIKPQLFQDIVDNNLFLARKAKRAINWNVVNMLNSVYIISPGKFSAPHLSFIAEDKDREQVLYKNNSSLPRAYFVREIKQFRNEEEVVRFMNNDVFNPSRMALTSENLEVQTGYDSTAKAFITKYTPNRVELKAEADNRAFMVLADAYYPKGWTATIDGEKVHIYQVNHMLRGVTVPSGEHKITFDFYPRSYRSAKIISYISVYAVWLLLIISLLVKHKEFLLSKFTRKS
ncbi:MAG: YfhO family protein [bacterium]